MRSNARSAGRINRGRHRSWTARKRTFADVFVWQSIRESLKFRLEERKREREGGKKTRRRDFESRENNSGYANIKLLVNLL